jgi:hypothetical protein
MAHASATGGHRSARHRFVRIAGAALLELVASLAGAGARGAPIQLGRADLTQPGYLISACGGFADGTNATIGNPLPYPGGSDCHAALGTAVEGSVSASAFFSAAPVATAIASGSAGFGFVRARAGFTGPNSADFPRGAATGGWMDRWTIDAPGLAGHVGSLSFLLDVEGVLHAEPGGNVQFSIIAFRDDQRPTSAPRAGWGGTGIFNRGAYDESVDETVTLALDFIFGEPFDLAIFARAQAGTASRSASDIGSSGYALFDHTLSWAGVDAVSSGGAPVDYTLRSASGIDWRQAIVPGPLAVPEPGSLALALAGALALLVVRATGATPAAARRWPQPRATRPPPR